MTFAFVGLYGATADVALPQLTNPQDVHPAVRGQLESAIQRTLAAGAKPPITYLGAGMTSIVLRDARCHEFKASRRENIKGFWATLEDEAEWLKAAGRVTPFVVEGAGAWGEKLRAKIHAPKLYRWHRAHGVIERECLQGAPGGWGMSRVLGLAHSEFERRMLPLGWTSPEFKEDSYIQLNDANGEPSGEWAIVDAGFAHRAGRGLLRFVGQVLDGKRPLHTEDTPRDYAFYLVREIGEKGGLSADEVRPMLRRLAELDPSIARSRAELLAA